MNKKEGNLKEIASLFGTSEEVLKPFFQPTQSDIETKKRLEKLLPIEIKDEDVSDER